MWSERLAEQCSEKARMASMREFHFVTLDMQLPLGSDDDALVSNGIKFLQELRGEYPELPIIVITGTYNKDCMAGVELIRRGATDFISKGTDVSTELSGALERHVIGRSLPTSRRLGCAWLAMRSVGANVEWLILAKGGGQCKCTLKATNKTSLLLEALYRNADHNGFVSHEHIWTTCRGTERQYFHIRGDYATAKRSPSQGAAKNCLHTLKEKCHIEFEIQAVGIRFFQPEK